MRVLHYDRIPKRRDHIDTVDFSGSYHSGISLLQVLFGRGYMKGQHDHPIQPTYRNYIHLIINVSARIDASERPTGSKDVSLS